MDPEVYLAERAAYSVLKLDEFRSRVAAGVTELRNHPELCIFAVGSYGRHEAGAHSDLDLFAVHAGAEPPPQPVVESITAQLNEIAVSLGHPAFSKAGKYLEPHSITDLANQVGSRYEDSRNLFTPRMLLLLESEPIYNDKLYDLAVAKCVEEYCRDYHKHPTAFYPRFFANDIMRYWKTLCLNYEANRTDGRNENKAKYRLKNHKLKFSRMMMCFSMISCLCDLTESDTPEKLIGLTRLKPVARLERISGKYELTDLYGELVSRYTWFLHSTDRSRADAEAWLTANKDNATRYGGIFGDTIYRLLEEVAKATGSDLRYLVV